MRSFGWFAATAAILVALLSMPTAAQAQRFYVDVDPYTYRSDRSEYYPYRDRSYRSSYRAYNRPFYSGKHKGWYKDKHHGWGHTQVGSRHYRRWY